MSINVGRIDGIVNKRLHSLIRAIFYLVHKTVHRIDYCFVANIIERVQRKSQIFETE